MNNLARSASLITALAGAIGFLYLWGFWKRFGINFLEFATLADLIRLSLKPVVSASLALIGFQLVNILIDDAIRETPPPPPSTESQRRAVRTWNLAWGGAAAVAYCFVAAGIWIHDRPSLALSGAPIAGFCIALGLGRYSKRIFGWTARQSALCFFGIACLPVLAFSIGANRSKQILDGEATHDADTVVWNGGTETLGNVRYLGTLGEFAFFWTKESTVLIEKWDDVAPIELRDVEPKKPE